MDVHIPHSGSLKEKRRVVKHLLETSRGRYGVAAAEVGHQDRWQRAELGFAAVSSTQSHVEEILESVERFVWSNPEIEVIERRRAWLDVE